LQRKKSQQQKEKKQFFFLNLAEEDAGIVNFFDCAFHASSWHFLRPALVDLFVDHWLALTPSLPGYSEFQGAPQIFVEEFRFLSPGCKGKVLACFEIKGQFED
jgi:hypothetical protein